MEKSKKHGLFQIIIISLIILFMITYIGYDFFKTRPLINQQVSELKLQYTELSSFLNTKIPEIDSTLKNQSFQIGKQTEEIEGLKTSIIEISHN